MRSGQRLAERDAAGFVGEHVVGECPPDVTGELDRGAGFARSVTAHDSAPWIPSIAPGSSSVDRSPGSSPRAAARIARRTIFARAGSRQRGADDDAVGPKTAAQHSRGRVGDRTALIAGATALVLWALRVKDAATRHTAWTVVVLIMLVLPLSMSSGVKLSLRVLEPAAATTVNDSTRAGIDATPQPATRPAIASAELRDGGSTREPAPGDRSAGRASS